MSSPSNSKESETELKNEEKQDVMNDNDSKNDSSWWGVVGSAWQAIQTTATDVASDFQQAFVDENQGVIASVKSEVQKKRDLVEKTTVTGKLSRVNEFLSRAIDTITTENPEKDMREKEDEQLFQRTLGEFQFTGDSSQVSSDLEVKPMYASIYSRIRIHETKLR